MAAEINIYNPRELGPPMGAIHPCDAREGE